MTPEQEKALALMAMRKRRAEAEGSASGGDYANTYFAQGTSGINEGIGNLLGAPVDLVNNLAIRPAVAGINKVLGTDIQTSDEPFLGSKQINSMMSDVGSIQPPSQDVGKQVVRRVGQEVGSTLIPALKGAKTVETAAKALTTAAGSGLGAAAAEQIAPGNPLAELAGQAIGGLGTGSLIAAGQRTAANSAARAAIPSKIELKTEAGRLYDLAEKNGVSSPAVNNAVVAKDLRDIASARGLISPTGRISEAYPKAREAIRLMDDYSKGPMTVANMKAVRAQLSDAANSTDGAEQLVATQMLKKFDEFINPLAPEISEANALYHRASKANTLDKLNDLSGTYDSPNSLRNQYKGLEREIIRDGGSGGFSPEELAGITRVAEGGRGENVARALGRFAPTGPVSFGGGVAAPFWIGNAIGGPTVGAAAATAAPVVGYGGRAVANALNANNANKLNDLVRNGGAIPSAPFVDDRMRQIIGALLAGQTANQAK